MNNEKQDMSMLNPTLCAAENEEQAERPEGKDLQREGPPPPLHLPPRQEEHFSQGLSGQDEEEVEVEKEEEEEEEKEVE